MALVASKQTADGADDKPIAPNQSLYIQNLPESMQKHDLKRALYMLFATYGTILDIVALKTAKMRGQAHIVFRDIPSATQAMRNCQGFEFFGREMRISYSKNRSDTISKLSGKFYEEKQQIKKPEQQQSEVTSSFPAPPGTFPGPPKSLPPPPGLPKPSTALQAPANAAPQNAPSPAGTKRAREESDEEDGAPMEEDDSDAEMDMSDDD